ncbi:putative cytosolic purine 5-nucleotidase [Aphelenchoides fujianensis]|nr:putative cytosolic purine 5-nucleotidase [Aphelenchoides fujianensis]
MNAPQRPLCVTQAAEIPLSVHQPNGPSRLPTGHPLAAQRRSDFAATRRWDSRRCWAKPKEKAPPAAPPAAKAVAAPAAPPAAPNPVPVLAANLPAVAPIVPAAAVPTTTTSVDASTATGEQDINKPLGGAPRERIKKSPEQRIFVGRSLRLDKIRFFGFDMDYTLCAYKSPALEEMAFGLIVQRMLDIGYPDELKKFAYNPNFAVRGLWFDYLYGNLLKVDGFGNILVAVHGFRFLKPHEIEELYPNKFLHLSDSRVYVLNTLFNLPETFLVACLVDYFDSSPAYHPSSDKTGVKSGESDMKKIVLANLEKYVEKDDRAARMLTELRAADRKTFLLTNSDYNYSNGVMTYLLGAEWTSFFDITVVDARKPHWFADGTVFREVNTKTGALKIGIHTGPLRKGVVYSGGSCDAFCRLVKCRGKDVLYVGDHIYGDVLRSKKARGWRTMLVVPELNRELTVWTGRRALFEQLSELELKLALIYKDLDNTTRKKPDIFALTNSLREVTYEMDQEYGAMGSTFRSGSRTTFFASQVERYADLYSASPFNLVYYPTFYFFRAPMMLLPHESTVDHLAKMGKTTQTTAKVPDPAQRQASLLRTAFSHDEIEEDDPPSEEKEYPSPDRGHSSGPPSDCDANYPMKAFHKKLVGYWEDRFLQNFIVNPSDIHRRAPEILRGYWARHAAFELLLNKALSVSSLFPSVHSSCSLFRSRAPRRKSSTLGAGFDTLYFRLRDRNVRFSKLVEVDFSSVTAKKIKLMSKNNELLQFFTAPTKEDHHSDLHAADYHLLGADLRQSAEFWAKLEQAELDFRQADGDPRRSIAAKFKNCAFINYEQVNMSDKFSSVMQSSLQERGILLPGLPACQSLETQKSRFETAGFSRVGAWTMQELYAQHFKPGRDPTVRPFFFCLLIPMVAFSVESLELLDERELLSQLLEHYCIVIAVKSQDEALFSLLQ